MPDQTDMILVEALQISCVIGIHPWERIVRQPLSIDLEITTDISRAASSDAVGDTIDYVTACKLTARIARDGQYQLIETLASNIASAILNLQGAKAVVVTVRKPDAVDTARSVAVRISQP